MSFRRIVCIILVLITLVSISSIGVSAASYCVNMRFNSLDDIKEDLTVFRTIAEGKITAVKINKVWYYQFTKSGSKVQIKVSAFMTQPKNTNLKKDVDALNSQLRKDSTENYTRICYYNTMTSKKCSRYTTYTTSMYRFKLSALGGYDSLIAGCDLTHFVTFTYNTKVLEGKYGSAAIKKYVSPSTSNEYVAALTRSTKVKAITPVITVGVLNTGKNRVYLDEYSVAGHGNAKSNTKNLIKGIYSASKLAKSVVTNVMNQKYVSAVYSVLTFDMPSWKAVSTANNSGKTWTLSENRKYCLGTTFTSPVYLSLKKDWVQVEIECNNPIGNAVLYIDFAFK